MFPSLGSVLAAGLPSAPSLPPVAPPVDGGLFDTGLVVGLGLTGLGVGAVLSLLYYFGVGGLRQIDSKNVLQHPLRQALLQTVQAEPGAHLRELAARHHTAVTNTQWHLRKLEMANLVKTQKVQGKRVYYPVQGGVATRDRAIQNAALRNPNAEAVRAFVAANPGAEASDVSGNLHLNPGTVRWHLRRLEDANLLRVITEGDATHFYAMTPNRPDRPPRPVRYPSEAGAATGAATTPGADADETETPAQ
ncbi:MAG: winged helix-turn-helix transcriptional regulator [Halobacteriales archaeon]|nr:winged helix-turn-helix transcriptional regulator [Halobacteriales archaeon]